MTSLIVSFLVRKHDFPEKEMGGRLKKRKARQLWHTDMGWKQRIIHLSRLRWLPGSTKTLTQGLQLKRQHKKRRNNNPCLQPFSGRLIWAVPLRFLWRSLFSHRIYGSAVQLIHSQGSQQAGISLSFHSPSENTAVTPKPLSFFCSKPLTAANSAFLGSVKFYICSVEWKKTKFAFEELFHGRIGSLPLHRKYKGVRAVTKSCLPFCLFAGSAPPHLSARSCKLQINSSEISLLLSPICQVLLAKGVREWLQTSNLKKPRRHEVTISPHKPIPD